MQRGFSFIRSAHELDDDTAVGLGAGGVGGDVVHILEGGVDHMALVGVHGLQGGAVLVLVNSTYHYASISSLSTW